MEIRKIAAEATWQLRQKVMWPTKEIEYVKLEDDEQGIHYGGFIENQLISVISLFQQGAQVQFRKFATADEQQGQGYGSRLLEYVLIVAKEMRADQIWCHARVNKVEYYQRFGLDIMGEVFERGGKNYVRMSKCLKDDLS